jgi:hypothetical protein
MVVVANLIGFAMFLVAAGVGGLIGRKIGLSNGDARVLICAALLVLFDITYRRARKSTMFGGAGGRFMFLPIWLWGVLLTIAGLSNLLRGR